MLKNVKKGIVMTALSVMMLSLPVSAFADASMDFQLKEMVWEDGQAVAKGTFVNIGDKQITTVNRVDVKVFLDDVEASNVYFENIAVDIKPGEQVDQLFIFSDIGESDFDAAKTWNSEEGEWEFTYLDEAAGTDTEAVADVVADAGAEE
jgi:hypothetical protein